MSRQVILLKRVQEALGQEKNNQTITGILDIKISFNNKSYFSIGSR